MKVEGAKWIKTDKTPGERAKETMAEFKENVLMVNALQKQLENINDDTTNIVNDLYSMTEVMTENMLNLMEACVNLFSELEADQRVMHERLKSIETKLED